MKALAVCLLASSGLNAQEEQNGPRRNKYAKADFPDMEEPFKVPNNRWGGNSAENVNYQPRKDKTPTDLKMFSKYYGISHRGPTPQGGHIAQAERATWFQSYKDEMSTAEHDSGFVDADGNKIYNRKVLTYNTDYWEFAQTQTEKAANWTRELSRCGVITKDKDGNPVKRQQDDPNCPNVIIINTDDMAWADLSVNNPSKLVPTPNLDRLVSKGINFRDGHSCTARCAPSRYCLMTGRHSWRRGDYHYKPMYLEHGRKIVPQMFKRAGYRTFLVGKAQPTEAKIAKLMSIDHYTECKAASLSEDEENEAEDRRRRREVNNFQRLVYTGGDYDPDVHDLMYMDVSETTGEALEPEEQKVCWYGAVAHLENKCKENWGCLAKKSNAAAYDTCVQACLNRQTSREKAKIRQMVEKNCPSRREYCTAERTDYKNFMLQEGVTKWGYDTGFNSFSYCCYPGAAFFRDDYNVEALRSYGLYVDIRSDSHMYNDNKRVRDDWISKNMQYLIGRTGLFKQYQGDKFQPWSYKGYEKGDRYTNLQVEREGGMPCAHLNEGTKCVDPIDVDQCDFMDSLSDKIDQALADREGLNDARFINSDVFETSVKLLEASYFLMHRNVTLDLSTFARLQQIKVLPSGSVNRQRRARTEEEKEDDKINVLNMPDHDGVGGHFRRIDPVITAEFFKDYINRRDNLANADAGKVDRREKVVEFVDNAIKATRDRVNHIIAEELKCTARGRRETPAKKKHLNTNNVASKSMSPLVAMKMLLRGSIKGFTGGKKDELKPDASPEEQNKLRENYEFSSNMYKFIYGEDELNADNYIQAPQGAEDKPRHFHSKKEAKTFVDDVTIAFLQYQGFKPLNGYDDQGKPKYTGNQMARFKLWEFAHSKRGDGTWAFKAPRTQPSFDSREVMKTFSEEAIKNFVEAKHFIEDKNQPFFMYCAYRAPHRPFSHIENYDYTRPGSFIGKAGEQLREFDDRIGLMMSALEKLGIADNTFVMFTSDNGPDGSGFANQDYAGHVRFGTFRGKKASVYEGGHRVPFLVWWPKGIHKSLWGSNYDLPVSQLDLFATFADMIKYPLPTADKCTYAFDPKNQPVATAVHQRALGEIKREHSLLHKLQSEDRTKAYFSNDADAKWTIRTMKTKCKDGFLYEDPSTPCPCANWMDPNWTGPQNQNYTREIADVCMRGSDWAKNDLSRCRCYTAVPDCPEGECHTDILPGDKLDFMTITGGRDRINRIFYQENARGKMVSVGAWDVMEDTQKAAFREALADVSMYHQFLTLEDKTGLVVGFDGCMAEDSHSFFDAFQPSDKENNQGKHHRRPAEIFAGKLGDLSLRMGRYKLVRFNPPKDRRTGPNAQHLRPNDQSEWPRDPRGGKNDKTFPGDGSDWWEQKWNKKCTWAPPRTEDMLNPYLSNVVLNRRGLPENDPSNTRHMCQRDFYYELWDLHTNPGEKNLCTRQFSPDAWEAVKEPGGYQADNNPRENEWTVLRSGGFNDTLRGLGGNTVDTSSYGQKLQEGKPEKHPDPSGIGSGKESTPVPGYMNDCCLLDYGDYTNQCTNGEDDVCEKSVRKPDTVKSAGHILAINVGKVGKWLQKPENWQLFANQFKDQLAFNWAERDIAGEKAFYEDLRSAANFEFNGTDYRARTASSLKVHARYRVPVFVREDENGNKVSCLQAGRQVYFQTSRGEELLKPDNGRPFWTTLIASEDAGCEESDEFMTDSFKSLEDNEAKKFLPTYRQSLTPAFNDFYSHLANFKGSNEDLAETIDSFFNENFRTLELNNVKIDESEQKNAAYRQFITATHQITKRFPTLEEYKNSTRPKYMFCNKFNKDCPSDVIDNETNESYAGLEVADPVQLEPGRKRRSVGPQKRQRRVVRRRRSGDEDPDNKYYISGEMFIWLMDRFEPKLTGFAEWAEENYEEGYKCKNTVLGKPMAYNDILNPDIRSRFCKPQVEPTECKVPEHEGPIGNGFNIERNPDQADRWPDATTEIKIKGFDKFTKFAECMKQVMLEIEGIAHMPELDEKLKHYAGAEDQALWREEVKNELFVKDGLRNGLNPRSLASKKSNVRGLSDNHDYMANEPGDKTRKYLHGAGSRYIQPNNDEYYTEGCRKFLVDFDLPDAYDVPGSTVPGSQAKTFTVNSVKNTKHAGDGPGSLDYDMDSSLMGYHPTKKLKRTDGKCVEAPRWLPDREADYIKYNVIAC